MKSIYNKIKVNILIECRGMSCDDLIVHRSNYSSRIHERKSSESIMGL